MNDFFKYLKSFLGWVGSILVLGYALSFLNGGLSVGGNDKISYSRFLNAVSQGQIRSVVMQGNQVKAQTIEDGSLTTIVPVFDEKLMAELLHKKVDVEIRPIEAPSLWFQLLFHWMPSIFMMVFWLFLMRQMQMAGGKGAMGFGKSRAKLLNSPEGTVTFADVAGVDEAKEQVSELVEFLKEPAKFLKIGGKIPRGVLMMGRPGTGKTLLARAIAGEAKVPFFSISGSDFVEMFVGVGASRVRDMFEQAKKSSPCIIFIDEIDAVGRHRGAGLGGGHDEREQTLNQLLVEMDGFEGHEGVIVIAATNRPDVLDPALLRPGRFDRRVVVDLPDVKGRAQILAVHLRKVISESTLSLDTIAKGTPGFSGADLANLVNEAALLAVRQGLDSVNMACLEEAKDKILMGVERRSMQMSEQERLLTAYHEAGHAIVGLSVPEHDPVYKVTIIPRGMALGVTMHLPEADRYSYSRRRLESQLCSLFGGRVAEELVFGVDAVTTGASNDIERATQLARNMVAKWGLSAEMGPLAYEKESSEVFLGHSVTRHKDLSDETTRLIDLEVRKLIDKTYQTAQKILQEKIDVLHKMAQALMTLETLDQAQINAILLGDGSAA